MPGLWWMWGTACSAAPDLTMSKAFPAAGAAALRAAAGYAAPATRGGPTSSAMPQGAHCSHLGCCRWCSLQCHPLAGLILSAQQMPVPASCCNSSCWAESHPAGVADWWHGTFLPSTAYLPTSESPAYLSACIGTPMTATIAPFTTGVLGGFCRQACPVPGRQVSQATWPLV